MAVLPDHFANPERGDVEITLGEKKYVLRPDFDAIAKIEAVTGKTLVTLTNEFRPKGESTDVGIAETVVILQIAIQALDGQKPPKNLGMLVVKAGLFKLVPKVFLYLSTTLLGEPEDDPAPGEAAAPATNQEA